MTAASPNKRVSGSGFQPSPKSPLATSDTRRTLSNIGKEFSFRSLKDISGLKHDSTVKDYLGYLRDAYLIDIVKKFDHSLKAQETYGKKIYAMDSSFIAQGKRRETDKGRILENIVYLHLSQTKQDRKSVV